MGQGEDRGGDDGLDGFFAAARADRPQPSDALVARVQADAAASRQRTVPPSRRRFGSWARLAAAFGGGGVLAGLGTAALAGLWVGLAQPAPLAALGDRLWPQTAADRVDLFPDFEEVLSDAEG